MLKYLLNIKLRESTSVCILPTIDRCQIRNYPTFKLLIYHTPEPEVPVIITGPEDRTVFIGTEISVTCTAAGDPSPQIYILKRQIPQEIDVTFEDDG